MVFYIAFNSKYFPGCVSFHFDTKRCIDERHFLFMETAECTSESIQGKSGTPVKLTTSNSMS